MLAQFLFILPVMQFEAPLARKLSLANGASFFFSFVFDGHVGFNPLLREHFPAMWTRYLGNRSLFLRDAANNGRFASSVIIVVIVIFVISGALVPR